jgi:hypothetical protein
MTQPDLTELYSALQKADAAGNTADARQLADYIRSQQTPGFDLASARPVKPGFDLASAKPVKYVDLEDLPPPPRELTVDDLPAPPPELRMPQLSLKDQLLRKIALGGRSAAEGVMSTFALPVDAAVMGGNLLQHGVNRVFGTNLGDYPTFASRFSQSLTDAGAPTPQTPGEQMGSAVTRGVTGALTGGGLLSPATAATAPNAIRAGLSGATGAAASEGTRQAGYGPGAQIIAGLAGGLTPGSIEEVARGAGRLAAGAVRPLTAAGQQRMAGGVLTNQATNPQSAITNLETAQPIVPGSLRNTGEASQDTGLMGVEKSLRSSNSAPFAGRLSEQNAARQTELSRLAGTDADIAAAQEAREAQTDALREAAFTNAGRADVTPVIQKIDTTLAGPIGKRDIASQALNWLRNKLVDGDGNVETDPESLYAIRQDINDAIGGKLGGDQAKFKLASGQLIQTRNVLDTAINEAAPGFKNYLTQYAALSKPINRMTLLQELQQKATTTGFDPIGQQYFLSPGAYSRALTNAQADRLTPLTADQTQRLEALRRDLENSQAVNGPLLKAPGSDTVQNLSMAQALGSGPLSALLHAKAPYLGWLYNMAGSDKRVQQLLTQAMLDPKMAALLMRNAAAARAATSLEGRQLIPVSGGILGTLASQPSGNPGSQGLLGSP